MRNTTILAAGLCLYVSPAVWAEEPAPSQRMLDPQAIAQSLDQSGNTQAATDILRERTNAEDATADDFIQLAHSLQKTSLHEQAVESLLKARQKFPADSNVIYQLGRAYIQAGNLRDAVNTMDMLIAMEPDNAMAYNAKGVAFDRAGNHFAAQEVYGMGLAITPYSVPLQNNMAMSFILDGRSKEAIDILERLYKKSSEQPKVRHNLALAYGLTGKRDKALELGLQDLSEEQAKENLKFYEHYASLQKQNKPVDLRMDDDQVIVDHPQEKTQDIAQPEPEVEQKEDVAEVTEDTQKDADETAAPTEEAKEVDVQQAEKQQNNDVDELSPAAGDEATPAKTSEAPYNDKTDSIPQPFGANAEYSYPSHNKRLGY